MFRHKKDFWKCNFLVDLLKGLKGVQWDSIGYIEICSKHFCFRSRHCYVMHKNAEFQNCLNPMVKINQCVLWDNMQFENNEFLGRKQHLTV